MKRALKNLHKIKDFFGAIIRDRIRFSVKGSRKTNPFGALRAKAMGVLAAAARGVQTAKKLFGEVIQRLSVNFSGGRRQKVFFREKSNRKPLLFGALRAKAMGVLAAVARGVQTAIWYLRAAIRRLRSRLGGGRRPKVYRAKGRSKANPFGALRAKAEKISRAAVRGVQTAIWYLRAAIQRLRSRLDSARRHKAFRAKWNRKTNPFGGLRVKAARLAGAIMRSIQTAVEFLGAAIYRLRSHFEYGLKTISIIAAITIMIAAAVCILPALAVKSEAALTVQDAGPTPATLYYPFHLAAPRIDNIKPQETETLRGAAAEEEDTETAVPPDQEDIKTPALPEAEQVYADAPKKEMSAKEMFKEEFPRENFGKTKRILARVIHGEGKGTKSITNRAAIVETVLNRVDARMRGDTPYECATAHSQFCVSRKCTKEELWIAEDVLKRWLKIRRGEDAEWILPKGYLWFHGTYPRHDWNVFRNKYHFRDKPRYKTPLHSKIYGD